MGALQPISTSFRAGYRLVVQEEGQLDYGCGTRDMSFYAPRTMAPIRSAVGRGRRIMLGWIRANPNGRATCDPHCRPYLAHGINWTFGDFAALPRELSLATVVRNGSEQGDRLHHRAAGGSGVAHSTFAQRFVPELRVLRPAPGNRSTSDAAALEITLHAGRQPQQQRVLGVKGRELEIVVRATARGDGCAIAEWSAAISFLRSEGMGRSDENGEASTLAIQHVLPVGSSSDGGNWTLLLDRSRSSNSSWADRSNISAPLPHGASGSGMGGEGSSIFHAYVDNSVIETIGDNRTAITARVFPQRGDSTSVMVSLRGVLLTGSDGDSNGACTVTATFSVWALSSAEHDWH